MAFMQAEITDKQHWIMVDGDGVDYFPADLIDVGEFRKALKRNDDMESAFEIVKDYTETRDHKQIIDMAIVYGYGVRSSASGYMDCTSWTVYGNKRAAEQAARQEQRECEGLD